VLKHPWAWLKWGCLAVSIVSLLVAAGLMWLRQHQDSGVTQTSAQTLDDAGTKVESPWMVERKGDRVLWRLKAEQAKQGLKSMHFTHPYLELFNENNEKITVQAEQGDLDLLSRNVHFQGKVKVDFQTWTLVSNSLDVEQASGDVRVKGRFTAEKPNTTIKGRGLLIHHKTYDMYIQHDVWVQNRNIDELGS